ncbi:hypothetical protein B0H65DRAFT_459399 [Neurospora tetraspora]|uniref:JmjC domain-containing protein n=1 Tax=Neurospora tetraspora TaxID=94610 RepID=A0AAE0JLF6_9PEZI|nr:hypothetical protein B0H65DRAFT_459399 [Neurospora tetraspora]
MRSLWPVHHICSPTILAILGSGSFGELAHGRKFKTYNQDLRKVLPTTTFLNNAFHASIIEGIGASITHLSLPPSHSQPIIGSDKPHLKSSSTYNLTYDFPFDIMEHRQRIIEGLSNAISQYTVQTATSTSASELRKPTEELINNLKDIISNAELTLNLRNTGVITPINSPPPPLRSNHLETNTSLSPLQLGSNWIRELKERCRPSTASIIKVDIENTGIDWPRLASRADPPPWHDQYAVHYVKDPYTPGVTYLYLSNSDELHPIDFTNNKKLQPPSSKEAALDFTERIATTPPSKDKLIYYVGPANDEKLPKFFPSGKLSREYGPIEGVSIPYIHMGEAGSGTAFHCEDADFRSYNVTIYGYKIWILVDLKDTTKFEEYFDTRYTDRKESKCDQRVRHQCCILAPSLLVSLGINFDIVCTGPGDLIVTEPRQYHAVINFTDSLAVSTNFVYEDDIPIRPNWLVCPKDGLFLLDEPNLRKFKQSPKPKRKAEVELVRSEKAKRIRRLPERKKGDRMDVDNEDIHKSGDTDLIMGGQHHTPDAGEDSANDDKDPDDDEDPDEDSANDDQDAGEDSTTTDQNTGQDLMDINQNPAVYSIRTLPYTNKHSATMKGMKDIDKLEISKTFAELTMSDGIRAFFTSVRLFRIQEAENPSLLESFRKAVGSDFATRIRHFDTLRQKANDQITFSSFLHLISCFQMSKTLHDGRERASPDSLNAISTNKQEQGKIKKYARYGRKMGQCVGEYEGLICFLPRSFGGSFSLNKFEKVIPTEVYNHLEGYGKEKLSALDQMGREFMDSVWEGKQFQERKFEGLSDAELANMELKEFFSHLSEV